MSTRSRLRLSGARCPYCHEKVFGSPERCPGCGLALEGDPDPDYGADGKRNVDGRRRVILVFGTVAIVATGIIARQFPEGDPVRAARAHARKELTDIMDLVLARRFDDATEALDTLLTENEVLAEAYIVRSLSHLGQGRFDEAELDARRGARFIAEGQYDRKSKGVLETGPLLAERARCIAAAAVSTRLAPAAGAALFDHLLAFGKATTCAEVAAWQQEAIAEIRQTTTAALAACPRSFECHAIP